MSGSRQIRNLVLIGFMGTGKSSVGRMLAMLMGYAFLDTDHMIERRAGKSINEIFDEQGEAAFRELERQVVEELAGQHQVVVSTGGGLGADPRNLELLKEHAFVACLWASPEVIQERVGQQTHRPLLNQPDPLASIRELLARREGVYRQADALVNTEMRSIKDVAQQVLREYRTALPPA